MNRFLSSDSHIVEPPDLWKGRMPSKYGSRAPRVERESDGDFWYLEDTRICSFTGGIQVGVRFDQPDTLRDAGRFEEVRPGSYQPAAQLEENERDGVYGSVVYPSAALVFYGCGDNDLFSSICRGYNDWLAEFCAYDPKRLKGSAMLSLDHVNSGIKELQRCQDMGLTGAMIPAYPSPDVPYSDRVYDPLWAAAQEAGVPLGLHVGTVRIPLTGRGQFRAMPASTLVSMDYWVKRSIADMVFSGVFERHPDLRVGSIEHELGWAPHFLDAMDYTYKQRPKRPGWTRFSDPDAKPSDYFRKNVFMSFQEDMRGLRERAWLGIDGLMWGSDYPHTETTFPRSADVLQSIFDEAGVSEAEREKITYSNVKRLYGFEI